MSKYRAGGRRWVRGVAIASVVVGSALAAGPARAHGDEVLFVLGGLMLLPSEVGAEVMTGGPDGGGYPMLGWAYQLPVDGFERARHRVTGALEWSPFGPGTSVRARAGYRWAPGWWELGVGVVSGPGRVRVSPEVGVRLPHGGTDAGWLVRLRADVAPGEPRDVRGVATVGWTLF
jgi:hypothetical protein